MPLAFFTDIHLELPKPYFYELFGKPLTGYLNWQKRANLHDNAVLEELVHDMRQASPNYYLCGGDLINIGLRRETKNALAFLQTIAPKEQIIYANGNHDAYTKSTDKRMRSILKDYFRPSPSKVETEYFDIITLNTGVPTPPFNATGLVGKKSLEKLKLMLKTQARPYILMLHHPLLEIEGGSGHKKLMDAEELIEVINSCAPALILHGHTHINSVNYINKIPMIGVSSASCNPTFSVNSNPKSGDHFLGMHSNKKAAHLASWLLIHNNLKLTLNTWNGVNFDRTHVSC